ncbi:MAG: hypothetical protein D6740_09665 [Alphaproteobacteria bacterium]|nr:MAG: hypothetical protein D6740_09665 [Alphaproteobacteria bacterium]
MTSQALPRPAGGLSRRIVDRRTGLFGFVGSVGLHLLVLGLLLVRWPQTESPIAEPEPMAVEFLVERAEPAPARPEKPQPPPQSTPQDLEIQATSTPGRIPVPQSKPGPPAKAAPARPRIEAVPRSKPRPPTRFDPEHVAALLDKARKQPSAPAPRTEGADRDEKKPAQNDQDAAAEALRERIAKASLGQALAARVSRCWTAPVGAKGVETMQVRIAVQLSREGRLIGLPRFLDVDSRRLKTDPYYRVFVESARRAVLACAPYDDLPQPLYRLWRQIEFTFSPRNMY